MSCLFWNCRGLGVSLTVLVLGDIIRLSNPDIVFISKTKCLNSKIKSLKSSWNLHGFAVERSGKGGGLAIFWKKDVMVITCSVTQLIILM